MFKKISALFLIAFLTMSFSIKLKAQRDPMLLAQQVMQFLQDADANGIGAGIGSLESYKETYDDLSSKLEDFKEVINMLGDGKELVNEVTEAAKLIVQTGEYLDTFRVLFSQSDNSESYRYLNKVSNLRSAFFANTDEFNDNFKKLLANVKNFKRGDASNVMQLATDLAKDLHERVALVSDIAQSDCYDVYMSFCAAEEADRAKAFMSAFTY